MFDRVKRWVLGAGICAVLGPVAAAWSAFDTVQFPSADGLMITADVYWSDPSDHTLPFICLFHQANFSRGEYREIAPRLVKMGYNCMAIDARSGKVTNGIVNETAHRAKKAGKAQEFEHAKADLLAALQYARSNFAEGPLIAWGSSYSASLIFKVSAENESLVDGSLSFSPNVISRWTRDWIVTDAAMVKHPVFVTSARRESDKWDRLRTTIPEAQLTAFLPSTVGFHGARALWKNQRDSGDYWAAVESYLESNFPPNSQKPQQLADNANDNTVARPASTTEAPLAKKPSLLGRLFQNASAVMQNQEPSSAPVSANSASEGRQAEEAGNRTPGGHGSGGHGHPATGHGSSALPQAGTAELP